MNKLKFLLVSTLILIFLTYGNITIANAKTIETVESNDSEQAVVDINGTGDYITIQDAISAGEKNILIKNGVYEISSPLVVRNRNTIITGESKENVKIVQTNTSADGVVIYADNSSVSNLTVDCQTYGGLGSAIVEGHSNNVKVSDCIVYGSNNGFSIYFAGKDYIDDADTIAGVETNNLDQNNVIENCTVYSNSKTDGVILALQGHGKLINNTIVGTRIAFYMCNSSEVSGNTVNNSTTEGIYVSIPAFNNVVKNNVINNCALSGIKVAVELEHPNDAINNRTYVGTGFTIKNNVVNHPAYFGMEIDELADSVICHNSITKCDYIGIYVLRSNHLSLIQNAIIDPGYGINEPADSNYANNLLNGISWNVNDNSGIFLDYKASDNIIHRNTISSSSSGCVHAICANSAIGDATITGNTYTNNIITGNYTGTEVQY